jgi:hypothetical protein
MRLLSIFYCVASLRRASKNVWKRGVALASIFIYATFVFGQVGTVYKVDGVAPNSLQSVYSSPTFRGGEIDWNLPPGATTSYLQDMFLNKATVPAPTIAFPTSCGLTGFFRQQFPVCRVRSGVRSGLYAANFCDIAIRFHRIDGLRDHVQ